jgi:iron-sulfur cluster repair protein YtfE (RIC family)
MSFDTPPRSERKLTPSRALAELKAQHDALRGMMDRCVELADALDAGQVGPLQLTREVARLRLAFEAHNKFEEQLLRPVLLGNDAFAEVRIDRMVEDHVGEHRAMRMRLETTETSALRDVVETLRAHLDAEERYLLSARVLRDDVVTIEGTG